MWGQSDPRGGVCRAGAQPGTGKGSEQGRCKGSEQGRGAAASWEEGTGAPVKVPGVEPPAREGQCPWGWHTGHPQVFFGFGHGFDPRLGQAWGHLGGNFAFPCLVVAQVGLALLRKAPDLGSAWVKQS